MSLINDALKQASQDQKKNPPPPSPLQFRPADEPARRNYTPPAILFAVLLVVLALGAVLVGYALQKKSSEFLIVNARDTEAPATPPESAPVESPIAAPATPTPKQPAPATALPPELPAAAPTAIETASADSVTNTVAAPVEPPKPVGPKLQGISYNPSRPSAVINGRTVYAGDRVGEFRVTSITQDTVTLASATETKVLSLSE